MNAASTATNDKPGTKAGRAAAPSQAASAAAGAADPGAAVAAARPLVQVSPSKMNLSEQVRFSWTCVVPAGTTPEDLDLKEEAFALVASLLHEGDDIRCMAADKRTIIDAVCVHRSGNMALARVTQVIRVPDVDPEHEDHIPAGFAIVEAKPGDDQPGFLVRRLADGVLLNAGHFIYTKEAARRFLHDHATVRGEIPQGVHWAAARN